MNRPFQGPGRTGDKIFLLVITSVVLILVLLTAERVVSARQLRTFYQQSPPPTFTFTPTPTSSSLTDTPTPPPLTDTPTPPPLTDTPTPPPPTDTPTPPPPTDTPAPLIHVTGGGWFDSPSGAYTPDDPTDADLTGRANFGFVAQHRVAASVPTGNTEFQFRAGALNFHSNSYQWLVINQEGGYAQFKGDGTIRGDTHPYHFMIWVGDGNPDTFHIKIWRQTPAGEFRIYDNESRRPIGGGSIVIHNGR